jgi:hypothetical protein
MLAFHLVMRHQMERGFATRPLQHGPMRGKRARIWTAQRLLRLLQRGQALRGPFGFCGINTDLSHIPKLRVS